MNLAIPITCGLLGELQNDLWSWLHAIAPCGSLTQPRSQPSPGVHFQILTSGQGPVSRREPQALASSLGTHGERKLTGGSPSTYSSAWGKGRWQSITVPLRIPDPAFSSGQLGVLTHQMCSRPPLWTDRGWLEIGGWRRSSSARLQGAA